MARDTIFRNADDVSQALNVPVLAVVPALVAVQDGRPAPRTGVSRPVLMAIALAALLVAGVLGWLLR